MRNQISGVFLCGVSLVFPLQAIAASWQPTAATHNGVALHALYAFEDGVETPMTWTPTDSGFGSMIDGEWVLSNRSDPSTTSQLFLFRNAAPNVDWTAQTIDLSGFYVFGVNPLMDTGTGKFDGWVYEPAIGWSLAPSFWYSDPYFGDTIRYTTDPLVPFVSNGDGTYTASWSYANNIFGSFGGATLDYMTLTFQAASPVPLPAPVWLFLSGLGTLATFTRSRNKQKTAIA